MKRQIINIDEARCNGCGRCASACAEGAIQMVDGKARLVSEIYCDGLGACLGECPVGAISIEEREAEPFDKKKTAEHLLRQAPPPNFAQKFGLPAERNWPIQLQLINPASPVFDGAEVVVAADCTAFSAPDFYRRYVKGKALIVFCPKLDHANDVYVEKLAAIFSQHEIRSVTVLRMIVPCCGGTSMIVRKAMEKAGKDIPVSEIIVGLDGDEKE